MNSLLQIPLRWLLARSSWGGVIEGIRAVCECPALGDKPGVDILSGNRADGNDATVAVLGSRMA